jgi:hypothetical protein
MTKATDLQAVISAFQGLLQPCYYLLKTDTRSQHRSNAGLPSANDMAAS